MTPFITEDYDMLKAFCDYRDIALFKVTETLTIEDCNHYASQLLNKSHQPVIQQNLKSFLEQHGLALPKATEHNTPYPRSAYETLMLKWSVLPQGSSLLYAAEVVDNAIHSAAFTDQIFSILNDFPVAIYCKDLYGTYVESNRYCDFLANGEKHARSITGKTDHHLIWSETAFDLQKHDTEVTTGQTKKFQELVTLTDGAQAVMQSTKSPLLDANNKIIGMIGISANTNLLDQQVQTAKQLHNNTMISSLSLKERECTQWLLQGLSARQVAQNMQISKRTAEAHMNNIKLKTNSYKLFQAGFKLGIDNL